MNPTPNDVPDHLVMTFATAMWESVGPGYDAEPGDDDIRAGLTAVLDSLKAAARVELCREVESLRSAWAAQHPQDAPSLFSQSLTPITPDTETTGSAEDPA